MLLLTNNNKKSIQKLRQVFASIILSASCIIPVVAGNEETHVDKPKKSTSFWIRTGLEIFFGAGFTWGVVEKIRNSRHINRLNQDIERLSKSLSQNEHDVIKKLKDVIDKFYNGSKRIYFLTNDIQINYQQDNLRKFNQTMELSVNNIDSEGFIKTYVTAKKLNLPEKPSDVTTNPFTETLYTLYLYEREKILNTKYNYLSAQYKSNQNLLTAAEKQLFELQNENRIDTATAKYADFQTFYDNLLTLCDEDAIYEKKTKPNGNLLASSKKNTPKTSTVARYILESYYESQKSQSVAKPTTYDLGKIRDKALVKLTNTGAAVKITDNLVLNTNQSIKTLQPSNLTELCQVFLSEFYLKSLCDYANQTNQTQLLETALNSISAAYLVLNLITKAGDNPKALIDYYQSEFYNSTKYQSLKLKSNLLACSNDILNQWTTTIKRLAYFNKRVIIVD